MRRVISLFLPSLAADRLRQKGRGAPPEAPLVTAARDGQRHILVSRDGAAAALGLKVGMPVAQARALVPGLTIENAAPAKDAEALLRLAGRILRRHSPIVALDPPDGVWIDAAGCSHLFGGEEEMLRDLLFKVGELGFSARAAMAGTTGAAHALARFAAFEQIRVRLDHSGRGLWPELVLISPVPAGGEAAAIGPLPIAALRLPQATVSELERLGFDRIGQLLKIPRGPLARRFGTETNRRLDQALGFAAEPLSPLHPPETIRVCRRFVEPIGTPGQLRRAIADLVRALCEKLAGAGLGARRLDLTFHRVDARLEAIRVGTAAPSREPAHLARLLADRLDKIDPGFGVETMRLAASRAEPLTSRQLVSQLAGESGSSDLNGLVDTLLNRLGPGRLYRHAPVASNIPERSLCRVPALAPARGDTWPAAYPRPARLLVPAEPIDAIALLPDYPPAQFIWRGRRHRVGRADGPERIFGEWWRREAESTAVRDYFRLEDESGARFWVYRAGDGVDLATGSQRWFLHGLFG
jgi:protein ImuB